MRPIDYFERGVRKDPERAFLVSEDVTFSYRQADELISSTAKGLYAAGFEFGDSVAVYSHNHAAAVIGVFSSLRAGGAWIPINVRNSASSNAEYMRYTKTRWIFFHSEVAHLAQEAIDLIPDLKGVICLDSSELGHSSLESFCENGVGTEIPDWSDPHGNPNAIFSRWPTGGTTGPSKGVEISNANVVTMVELGINHYVNNQTDDIVHLAVAPITHAAGLIINIFAPVAGTTVIHKSFDTAAVLEAIQKHRVTHIFLPPTAYYALLDHPSVRDYDSSSLRQILIAAAPVSPDKFKRGVEVFGPVICQCYGQAEVPMLVSMLSCEVVADAAKGIKPERLKSCGEVTSCTQVSILDNQGAIMPVGERGEICCRGPLVTPGYFERPEANVETRQFGWHHTGDIGYLDEDNFLYIVDRKKDMIISGGFNVFATEVEAPILAMPEVLECAVIGVPDDKWGELIKAVVVLNPSAQLNESDVIATCRDKLGSVKTPKSVEFWDEIPKTAVGKTDKKVIRKKFWSLEDREVN